MKKQYINPAIEVVEMKMEQCLLEGSQKLTISGNQKNEDALGRGVDFDDWDD